MVELVDTYVSGAYVERHEGSSPFLSIFWKRNNNIVLIFINICLRRATFVQSHKSGEKDSLKNFSVILSVSWFTIEDGESLHPILSDGFSIFILVISTQSDEWKIFSWRFFLFLDFWDKIDIFEIAKFIFTEKTFKRSFLTGLWRRLVLSFSSFLVERLSVI